MKINTLDKITAAKVTALLSAAVVTASSMSGVTAYAEELPDAYNAAELAEEVLAPTVADPTKFDFFGTWVIDHDKVGNPDPQIVSNGDGTYTIIIYEGQSVAFPVNNPWADLGVVNTVPQGADACVITENDLVDSGGNIVTDWTNNLIIEGVKAGSAVVEVGAINIWDETDVVSNRVTVGLFVLPAVPGAQAPTLTQKEIKSIASYERDKEYFKDHTPENGWTFEFGADF